MPRRTLQLAALVAAVTALAGCGGGGESTTTSATLETTTTTETTTKETTTTPGPDAAPPTTVTIVVRDGKVVGGLARPTLTKGEKVVLVVRSDVADEVHLHGYDRSADVTPGKAARLAFVASIPGRFEVELEQRGLAIADLTVGQ